MGKNKRNPEEIESAIKESYSIAEALRKLGVIDAGGNYRIIKRFIKENNIDISHFTGQLWSKGKEFPPKRNINEYLVKDGLFKISSHHLRLRLLREGFFEKKCYKCNLTEWNGKDISLELEHINGIHEDNRLENLTLLCPNCHAQTETYRGRKKKRRGAGIGLQDSLKKNFSRKENEGSSPSPGTKKRIKPYKICKICGKEFHGRGKAYCSKVCSGLGSRRISRPNKEQLEKEIKENNFLELSRKYGVSDNAIRKWARTYGLM